MSYHLQSLTVNGVAYPNPATFKMDNNKKVVANYTTATLMSVIVKNSTAVDKKILVTTNTEYTVPANGSTTVPVKTGDVITLE